jgi:hypothetical protein
VVIENGEITLAKTSSNEEIVDLIKSYYKVGRKLRVAIEDIRPYSLQLSPDVIETCKWIGELKYRLKSSRIAFKLIGRSEVKKWAYDTFPEIVEPIIRKRIKKKGLVNKDGSERKTSHVWINDQAIIACMREHWDVRYIGNTKRNNYGLNSHSWQALALGTYYLNSKTK